MDLSESELERYDRQLRIRGWDINGQKRLKASKVAVVGLGGLGSASSIYLAAAGVGSLTLIDHDKVSLPDLNRQILYSEENIGLSKAEAAKTRIESLNSKVKVNPVESRVTEKNIGSLIGEVDVVVDGLDNWKTRFIINEYCVKKGIPLVHGGVSEFYGQITTIIPRRGPCLRCIFPTQPLETMHIPIFGATPAVIASIQAAETIKIITGIGKPLVGRLLLIDLEEATFEEAKINRNPNCPTCSSK